MKVDIGPYKNWIGPYQIAEMLLFWKDKDEDHSVHEFGEWLNNITWLRNFCTWIDRKKTRRVKVRIDYYDTWSMDNTLAYIVLPMLKQLKATKCGSPFVDDDDVPMEIRSTNAPPVQEYETDDNIHLRWAYVLDEMIFAFETILIDNWDEQFWKVHPEMDLTDHPEDKGQLTVPLRWKVEGECDWTGRQKMQDRITNGFRLFGKYYQGLWD
jgi:hypothetical protein